jgi:N-acetylglucosaminyl-diphospho-decaprenol L-rhamnosyltransferase
VTEVTVIVGNFQGADHLPACLESLAAQTRPPAEVIVVDAGSTDESRTIAIALGAHLLERPNNGLGWLYNEGARAAQTDYVLLANPDVAFDARCLELLTDALDSDGTIFAADPRQLDWNGEKTIHARTTLRRGPLLRTAIPGLQVDPVALPHDGPPVPTAWANAGGMLVRRERLLELGGFDETFFLDYEDIDLGWRAWLRGWGSVYVPEAAFRHKVGGSTSEKTAPRRLTSSHHNLTRFALKCFPPGAAAKVVVAELIRALRAPRAVGPALGRVLIELPAILRERRRLQPSRELFEHLTSLENVPS